MFEQDNQSFQQEYHKITTLPLPLHAHSENVNMIYSPEMLSTMPSIARTSVAGGGGLTEKDYDDFMNYPFVGEEDLDLGLESDDWDMVLDTINDNGDTLDFDAQAQRPQLSLMMPREDAFIGNQKIVGSPRIRELDDTEDGYDASDSPRTDCDDRSVMSFDDDDMKKMTSTDYDDMKKDSSYPKQSSALDEFNTIDPSKVDYRNKAVEKWLEKRQHRKWYRQDPHHAARRRAAAERQRVNGKFQKRTTNWISMTDPPTYSSFQNSNITRGG
jgi:hypothetical protein